MKGILFILLAMMVGIVHSAMSPATRFIMSPENSLVWHTYLSGSEEISWDWPDGAMSATLTIGGKAAGETVNYERPSGDRPVTTWQPTLPVSASGEDVLSLTVTFYTEAEQQGEVLVDATLECADLGVVRGVNGATTDVKLGSTSSRRWTLLEGDNAVVPVMSGTTALVFDGMTQTLGSVPGWKLWRNAGSGYTRSWTLTTDESQYTVGLHLRQGVLMLFR